MMTSYSPTINLNEVTFFYLIVIYYVNDNKCELVACSDVS